MAGKARVHELAKELGLSSKQVLSKLQDLGANVKSPSSTVEAPVARQLRESVTGRGQAVPSRRAWPHTTRGGNDPYTPPRRDPNAGTSPSPRPRRRQRAVIPEDVASMLAGQVADDSWNAAVRRAQAASAPKPTSRRREQHRNPIVDVILNDGGTVSRSPGESFPPVVHEWAQRWTEAYFEPSEVAAWLAAGIKGNDVDGAARLRRAGWTPTTWPDRRRDN